MQKYSTLFSQHEMDDFFILPFMKKEILEEMSIDDKGDLKILIKAIDSLKSCTPEGCKYFFNFLLHFLKNKKISCFGMAPAFWFGASFKGL